jgi:hypothetical protein
MESFGKAVVALHGQGVNHIGMISGCGNFGNVEITPEDS